MEVDQRGDSTGQSTVCKKFAREISEKLGRMIELRGPGRPKKNKKINPSPFSPSFYDNIDILRRYTPTHDVTRSSIFCIGE